MIGFLQGVLVHKEPPLLLLDVGGVGYEVEAPLSTFFNLPAAGETVRLRTHLLVREGQHILFGFWTEAERRLFRDLLKVSGVGARTALGLLSGMSVEAFVRAVESEDLAALTRLPGVGRKTAERLVIEMRDRVRHPGFGVVAGAGREQAGTPADSRGEALDALLALGYKPNEARRMLEQVSGDGLATEEILRQVLRSVAVRS